MGKCNNWQWAWYEAKSINFLYKKNFTLFWKFKKCWPSLLKIISKLFCNYFVLHPNFLSWGTNKLHRGSKFCCKLPFMIKVHEDKIIWWHNLDLMKKNLATEEGRSSCRRSSHLMKYWCERKMQLEKNIIIKLNLIKFKTYTFVFRFWVHSLHITAKKIPIV